VLAVEWLKHSNLKQFIQFPIQLSVNKQPLYTRGGSSTAHKYTQTVHRIQRAEHTLQSQNEHA
jgi:hypothetical protein